ncbi:MAG: hypothetical protein WBQ50_21105 [Nocardioides sp.]
MFPSRFMPCETCGGSVELAEADEHRCDPARLVEYQMFGMREEIADFESDFHAFVGTGDGLFETWVASRQVRASRP